MARFSALFDPGSGLAYFLRCAAIGSLTNHAVLEPCSGVNVYRRFVITAFVCLALVAVLFFKSEFFDPASLLLTIGGALTATFFSYSRNQLQGLIVALRELTHGGIPSAQECARELRRLTELYRLQGIRGLENQERHLTDPFLKYAVELLVDLNNEDKIRLRLEHQQASLSAAHEINRQILATLGKLLPSFGLIGTLIGMVLMLQRLASLDANGLPAALGLSVLTTLYGAVSANVVVAPLLSRLQALAVEQEVSMNLIKEWTVLLSRGETRGVVDRLPTTSLTVQTVTDRLHDWHAVALGAQR